MYDERDTISIAFIGEKGSGKSTLVGRLLNSITGSEKRVVFGGYYGIQPYQRDYHRCFETRKVTTVHLHRYPCVLDGKRIVMIDTPSEARYTKNVITGMFLSDYIVYVFYPYHPNDLDCFEKSFGAKIRCAKGMGFKKLIVLINQLEKYQWTESRYSEWSSVIKKYFLSLGWADDCLHFMPTSAIQGDNVVSRSEKIPWYKGPILIDLIKNLNAVYRPLDGMLRVCLYTSYDVRGFGFVMCGRVVSGHIETGQHVMCYGKNNLNGRSDGLVVKSIMSFEENCGSAGAGPGSFVGVHFWNIGRDNLKRKGVIVDNSLEESLEYCEEFFGEVILSGVGEGSMKVGSCPVLHIHTTAVESKILSLEKIEPLEMLEKKGEDQPQNETDTIYSVKMSLKFPVLIEPFCKCPLMGRFILLNNGEVLGSGTVSKITKSTII